MLNRAIWDVHGTLVEHLGWCLLHLKHSVNVSYNYFMRNTRIQASAFSFTQYLSNTCMY